jgi:hypothetical protein
MIDNCKQLLRGLDLDTVGWKSVLARSQDISTYEYLTVRNKQRVCPDTPERACSQVLQSDM